MNKNLTMEIVENIKETADKLKAKETKSEFEKGLLLAYADSLGIIQGAFAGYDLAEIGLDFDIDKRYL